MPSHFLQEDPKALAHILEDTSREMIEQQAAAKARSLHVPYINLHGFPIDLNVLALFSKDMAERAGGFPFFKEGRDLRVAAIDPQNPLLLEQLKILSKKYKSTIYLVSEMSFHQTLVFYSKIVTPQATYHEQVIVENPPPIPELRKKVIAESAAAGTTATSLMADLFALAYGLEASDIHLEPGADKTSARLRIDGVLQPVVEIDKPIAKSLVTRIKMLSKLKLNVSNQPQDGRLTFLYDNKPIDVRVSILPAAGGEGVVLRLLGVGAQSLNISELGLRGRALEVVTRALHKPNGMMITTGPTGSGKTTTLYSFLMELNKPGVKIITLEDPVEYKLVGIQQTPIDHTVDFNFANALRSVLRQDPDIVMVGEIRDQETAETALQAALTGHVVLSTLHTNDASGAVPRLITMDIKPFVIAPAINAIIAQRLVRKLCQACKKEAKPSAAILKSVEKIVAAIPANSNEAAPKKLTFYHSEGCDACHNLGYKGRIGIYEVIEITDPIRDLILKEGASHEIRQLAVKDGMLSLLQDGILKALEGITDVEEVFRVAGES